MTRFGTPVSLLLRAAFVFSAGLAGVTATGRAQMQIVLGGNSNSWLAAGLNDLGFTYTDAAGNMTPNPASYQLGAGDFIIIGNDGGTPAPFDYTSFLNAGGRLIVVGGSTNKAYLDWVTQYFNITDTANAWHTDGAWHVTTVGDPLVAGLPTNYTFEDNNATLHMLGFNDTPYTIRYGYNDENVYVGAYRYYGNGGSFNYLSLDVGGYGSINDYNLFVLPWLANALSIPEPSEIALIGAGLVALVGLGYRRRRRRLAGK